MVGASVTRGDKQECDQSIGKIHLYNANLKFILFLDLETNETDDT